MGLIPGSGRVPGEGHGNPLQYSCLGNPMDRGTWWATVHRVAQSWTQLKRRSSHTGANAILPSCGKYRKLQSELLCLSSFSAKFYTSL